MKGARILKFPHEIHAEKRTRRTFERDPPRGIAFGNEPSADYAERRSAKGDIITSARDTKTRASAPTSARASAREPKPTDEDHPNEIPTRKTETSRKADRPSNETENIRKKKASPSKNPEKPRNGQKDPPRGILSTVRRQLRKPTHCPGRNLRGEKFPNFRTTLTHSVNWEQDTEIQHLRAALPQFIHLPALAATRFPAHHRN